MNRLAISVLVSALPLLAGRIDVTNQTFAPVHHGASVIVEFGVWNYGVNNPGSSPYPTALGVNIVTQAPDDMDFSEYLFAGWVESLDGSVYAPLHGAGGGSLLLRPGVFDSAGTPELPVGVLHGSAYLAASEALFGPNFAARIVLQNLGPDLVVGIGPGYAVRNAVSVIDVAGFGPRTLGGITGTVTVANPEPATWILVAGAAAAAILARRRRSMPGDSAEPRA